VAAECQGHIGGRTQPKPQIMGLRVLGDVDDVVGFEVERIRLLAHQRAFQVHGKMLLLPVLVPDDRNVGNLRSAVVETAGDQRQLDLLRAHPDLAGKLALDGGLTKESTSEQAGAGLDQCTPDEFARFKSLNDVYTAKFGFPFILAVAGYGRHEILEIFERRVGNDVAIEMREALDQVHRIALFRLIGLAENGVEE